MGDAATLNTLRVEIDADSGVGAARRLAADYAAQRGADESGRGRLSIVVTELANNLVRHAGRGSLLIQTVHAAYGEAIEIQAVDKGPGIADPERCLRDGYSSAGTAGTGLGAVQRLSNEFDLFSTLTGGTVVLSRLHLHRSAARSPVPRAALVDWGYTAQPAPRETCNGDAWAIAGDTERLGVLVADGLGHGPLAAEASTLAADLFRADPQQALTDYVEFAHTRLARTRGAALAACQLDLQRGRIAYLGIGNVAGVLITSTGMQGLISHNGTVGQHKPRPQPQDIPCPTRGTLVMHTDGIRTQWRADTYPGLWQRHPAVVAATLARDHRRGTDDSTVVVMRLRAEAPRAVRHD